MRELRAFALAVGCAMGCAETDEEGWVDAGADEVAPESEALEAAPSFCASLPPPPASGQWQSSRVKYDSNGTLTYTADSAKNRIPDFSYAGYRYGEATPPNVTVRKTIGPVSGDDTAKVQAAIDEVGARTPDSNGFRGAVLLQPGRYDIAGVLRIKKSGVVLRGSGDGSDASTSTILVGKGDSPHQRTLIVLGTGDSTPWDTGSATNVTDSFVQVGARSFKVADPTRFDVDDEVVITHPSSQKWIDALGGGGVVSSAKWSAGSKDITYVRRIRAIDGTKLTFDAPIFNHLDKAIAQARVAPVTSRNLVARVGLEKLRVDIETDGGEDEDHAWDAIGVVGAEDSWVRDVTALHFGHAGVFTSGAIRISVLDVEARDPVAIKTGGRMYNFDAESRSQLVLFSHCKATNGRHHFISNGTSSTSGIVWHRCTSNSSTSEGHRHWSQGLLYDRIEATGGSIALINRGDWGTSHGWGAAHSVVWNYNKKVEVQKPPTAQNYAISSSGSIDTNNHWPGPQGFSQIQSGKLVPESLYEAQLCDRLQ
jgi:hypothetical protein